MPHKPSEFEIIHHYFEGLTQATDASIVLPIGDDCTVLAMPEGKQLALSIDTLVEGVHFPKGAPAQRLAKRALASALSDLAAAGAEPAYITLALSLPDADTDWLASFSAGLSESLDTYGVSLVGGDTTKGPLTISIQVHGFVEPGDDLRRDGAVAGDVLLVTGTLGDGGAALALFDRDVSCLNEHEHYLLSRYYEPTPRFAEVKKLRQHVSACIDISDGLLADAEHIARRSNVDIEIFPSRLPLSQAIQACAPTKALELALSAGDDYELLMTMREDIWREIAESNLAANLTEIGRVTAGEGRVSLSIDANDDAADDMTISKLTAKKGYKHFE